MNWEEEKRRIGKELVRALYHHGLIRTWYRDNPQGWRLVSGLWSPLYIQLRPLSSYPELLKTVGGALGRLIAEECSDLTRVIGVATAGIPIATAISLMANIPSCFTRRLEGVRSLQDLNQLLKGYGEHSMIEGILEDGDRVGIVDDLVTKFDSKVLALKQLEFELQLRGLQQVTCSDIIVVLDREQGATERAKDYVITLHSLIPFRSQGLEWLKEVLADREYEIIRDYLQHPEHYQDPRVQAELAALVSEH
jgi:orotate phosphoribosyltransferase